MGDRHRHLPLYWFPRDCPRATWWPTPETSAADLDAFCDGRQRRVHAIEWAWLERVHAARLVAYRLPETPFERYEEAGGYWVARETVEPLDLTELGNLLALHERAEIELRLVSNLWPLWNRVVASTLEFSGVRLRHAAPPRLDA